MLYLKSTSVQAAPGVFSVEVAAKPPGKTFMIYAAVDGSELPADFIGAVESLGFQQVLSKTYTHQDGRKVTDLHFSKAGTDIFEGWTDAEKETNLRRIDEMLAGFKISVTPRVMALAEAFR